MYSQRSGTTVNVNKGEWTRGPFLTRSPHANEFVKNKSKMSGAWKKYRICWVHKYSFLLLPRLGPKDSGQFGPLPHSSLSRSAGDYLTFRPFCPRLQCRLFSPALTNPVLSGSYPGPLSFPFPAPDIHAECTPTFLFLRCISCMWRFSYVPFYAACTWGISVDLIVNRQLIVHVSLYRRLKTTCDKKIGLWNLFIVGFTKL